MLIKFSCKFSFDSADFDIVINVYATNSSYQYVE